jgi:SAM-dependent methyltransferase
MSEYTGYILAEWEYYQAHPERFDASIGAVRGRNISRVLDVGCGAGQELLPFVRRLGARGAGVDISPEAIEIAREQFIAEGCEGRVEFFCSAAESLPFGNNSFDVVVCRLALPYTGNAEALSEMARVLQPGGLLILKIHHLWYYCRRFWLALGGGKVREACAICRIFLNGTLYHLTGCQPKHESRAREVFQTRWMLRRIVTKLGLEIRGELQDSDSNRRTPVFVIEKGSQSNSMKLKANAWKFWFQSWVAELSFLASSSFSVVNDYAF